jgi:regulator of protease activity HflC (stomatin/prohibitin superfamily)
VEVYRGIGVDYAAKIIYPLEQESNKAATAQFVAGELITKREEVKSNMETLLREKLGPRGIVVESISIIDFKFSPSFSQAIEAKVTAEQNALAAKNKLEQVKYEAEQRIAQAEGEARAIEIQVKSINQAGGDNYVKLKQIEKWSGNLPYVVGGNTFVDLRAFGLTDISNSSKENAN